MKKSRKFLLLSTSILLAGGLLGISLASSSPTSLTGVSAEEVSDTIDESTIDYGGSTTFTYTGASGAVYYGVTNYLGMDGAVELPFDSNYGIVTTTSGGTIKRIEIYWDLDNGSWQSLGIYARNTAYTSPSDLASWNSGGGITYIDIESGVSSATYTFTDSYAYVGIASYWGNVAFYRVIFVWDDGSVTTISDFSATASTTEFTTTEALNEEVFTVSGTKSDSSAFTSDDYTVQIGTLVENELTNARDVVWGSTYPYASDNTIRFTSLVPNTNDEYPYVDITINVTETAITSIVISGDMSTKSYRVDDSFDPSGLVVTGLPADVDVTNLVTWSFSPEVATVGVSEVTVTASYGDITTSVVISGIEVSNTVLDTLTPESLGITSTSGFVDVTYTGNSGITYLGYVMYRTSDPGIVINANYENSGISTVNTGTYTVKSITLTFTTNNVVNSGSNPGSTSSSNTRRYLAIFASNTAYEYAGVANVDETQVDTVEYPEENVVYTYTYTFTRNFTNFRLASNRSYIDLLSIEVEWSKEAIISASDDAISFAQSFLADLVCDETGNSAPSVDEWNTLAASYATLSDEAKAYINDESSNSDIIACLERYDYILGKYGADTYTNFLNRDIISSESNTIDNPIVSSGDYVLILIIAVSLLIVTTAGVFIVMNIKKKESSK